ncbi:MAG: hypothetical protein Q4C60_11525 [Eubacteriales bacterium]|nr:hypothetical protein [Eubacteriales bacterium]
MEIDFFSIFVLLAGVYILYAAILLKTQKKITKSIMMNQNRDVKQIKDKEGFVRFMFVRTMVVAVVTIAAGLWGLIEPFFVTTWVTDVVVVVAFTLMIVYYLISIRKADKEFCR